MSETLDSSIDTICYLEDQNAKLLANAKKCLEEMESSLQYINRQFPVEKDDTLLVQIEATRKLIAECSKECCVGGGG